MGKVGMAGSVGINVARSGGMVGRVWVAGGGSPAGGVFVVVGVGVAVLVAVAVAVSVAVGTGVSVGAAASVGGRSVAAGRGVFSTGAVGTGVGSPVPQARDTNSNNESSNQRYFMS